MVKAKPQVVIPKGKLQEFYADKAMMNAWADFIAENLKEIALERVFRGEDTKALPEANTVIRESFKKLKGMFEPEPKRKVENRGV